MKSTELAAVPLTMSTLEIAGLTGKRHDHVVRDARKMLQELDIQASPQMWGKVASDGGAPLNVAYLPKRECLILVSGYSTELRARIIDRWMQLEAALANPATLPANSAEEIERTFGIVRMLAHKLTETEKKISKLEAKIEVNPHHAVPEYLALLDLAIEYGAHQRGRRPLCRVLGNRMEKRARELGVQESVVRTISGRRLFEQRFARVFMREAGLALIASHNHRAASVETGQGVIRFPARAGA